MPTTHENEGYKILPGLLTADEVYKYKNIILDSFSYDGSHTYHASNRLLIENEVFWDSFVNKRLLDEVKKFLEDENIFFIPHTDVHINLKAGGWHRDAKDRVYGVGSDWDSSLGKYGVIRVAIYLSSYEENGTTLFVLPNSHKKESNRLGLLIRILNKIRRSARTISGKLQLPNFIFFSKCKQIKPMAGDCILFDERLVHAGGKINFKSPKVALFFAYGIRNQHSENHMEYIRRASEKSKGNSYIMQFPEKLNKILEDNNIKH